MVDVDFIWRVLRMILGDDDGNGDEQLRGSSTQDVSSGEDVSPGPKCLAAALRANDDDLSKRDDGTTISRRDSPSLSIDCVLRPRILASSILVCGDFLMPRKLVAAVGADNDDQ
jgi:hypothetical protein